MFETNLDGDGFQVSQLSNGIHEFHWRSTERSAVDLWVEYNDLIYSHSDETDTLYFLHIIKGIKFPPISYIVRKAQQLQAKYPVQPSTRTALLFPSRFFAGFINTLTILLNRKGKDTTRVFGIDERDIAIEWLLTDNLPD